jgi:hypothetical protein
MIFDVFTARSGIPVVISSADHTFSMANGLGPRALYVGSGGDVIVLMAGATANITFSSVPGGSVLPIQFGTIVKTGTTAGSMVALF